MYIMQVVFMIKTCDAIFSEKNIVITKILKPDDRAPD